MSQETTTVFFAGTDCWSVCVAASWSYIRYPSKRNICITFIQCWASVEDVGPTLYNCFTNDLCFPGMGVCHFVLCSCFSFEAGKLLQDTLSHQAKDYQTWKIGLCFQNINRGQSLTYKICRFYGHCWEIATSISEALNLFIAIDVLIN